MNIKSMQPISNYCLIKLESNDSIALNNGCVLYMPRESQQLNGETHKPLRGEVVGLPKRLYFKQGDHTGMKWRTELELEIGDKVILRRPAVSMALSPDRGSYFVEGEDIFIYMKYYEIVLGKRGEDVIVLNGFIIVEPLTVGYSTTLIVPDSARTISKRFGTVRFIGKPNQEYHNTKNSKSEAVIVTDEVFWARKENGEFKIDAVELQVGDRVQFKASSAIPVEQELFKTLMGRYTLLYRMQRFNIQAKL